MNRHVDNPASALQVPDPHDYKWRVVAYYHSGRKAFTVGCTNDNAKDLEVERINERNDIGRIDVKRGERNRGH